MRKLAFAFGTQIEGKDMAVAPAEALRRHLRPPSGNGEQASERQR